MMKINRTTGHSFFIRCLEDGTIFKNLLGPTPIFAGKDVRVMQIVFHPDWDYVMVELEFTKNKGRIKEDYE